MELGLVLELLSRNGKVQGFFKLTQQQTHVGRAYNNDIVLENQYICPNHMCISLDNGNICLVDKQSINGIKNTKNEPLTDSTNIELGQSFIVGGQLMRIESSAQQLANTVKLTVLEEFSQRYNHWYWALLSAMVFFTAFAGSRYLDTYTEIIWSKFLFSSLPPVFALITVLFCMTIWANLFNKDMKIFTGLVIGSGIALLNLLLQKINAFISFNWGDGLLLTTFSEIGKFATIWLAIWAILYFISHMSFKKISITSVILVLAVQGLMYASKATSDKVKTYAIQGIKVLPDAALITTPEDYQAWIEKTNPLFDAAAKEAIERRKSSADEDSKAL